MRQHRCPQVRLIHTSSLPHELRMHEWATDTHHCFPFYRMSRARSIASMLSGTSAFTRISHGADTFLFLGRMKRSCQKRLTAWTKPKDIAVWALRGNLRSNARQTSSYVDVHLRQQHREHRRTRYKANGNSLQIKSYLHLSSSRSSQFHAKRILSSVMIEYLDVSRAHRVQRDMSPRALTSSICLWERCCPEKTDTYCLEASPVKTIRAFLYRPPDREHAEKQTHTRALAHYASHCPWQSVIY